MALDLFPIDPNVFLRAVHRVEIKTAYGPKIVLDDPFNPEQTPNPLLERLKPQVTLFVSDRKVSFAPYGDPPPTKWPLIKNAAIAAGVLGGAGLLWYLFKARD